MEGVQQLNLLAVKNTAENGAKQQRTISDTVLYNDLVLSDVKPIGSGTFGLVYKMQHKLWGCEVAYKKLAIHYIDETNHEDAQIKQKLTYEAEIHRQLRHPNIVSMIGIVFEPGQYGILLEYVAHRSWTCFRTSCVIDGDNISCIAWILKTKLAHEISCGMTYLHNRQPSIIHCDLKLQNILIGEQITAKISDFGLAKWKDYTRSHTSTGAMHGTMSHIPPEKWIDHTLRPTDKFDVFGFGILFWEMLTEQKAYEECGDMIPYSIRDGKRPPVDYMPPGVPEELIHLLVLCWNQQAVKRPTFEELVNRLSHIVDGPVPKNQIKKAKVHVHAELSKRSSTSVRNSEHCMKIRRVHQMLCESIRRTKSTLLQLVQENAVSFEDYETISSKRTLHGLANRLLLVISKNSISSYECFLRALDATDQRHLHCLLEQTEYVIERKHRDTVIVNFSFLQENIISDEMFMSTLLQDDVLDETEVADIRALTTDHARTALLQQFILRTSNKHFEKFLEVLNKTNHEHACQKLRDTDQISEDLLSCSLRDAKIASGSKDSGLEEQQGGGREDDVNITQSVLMNEDFNLNKFLTTPTLLHVMSGQCVAGIAVLGSQVFITRATPQVNV